MENQIKIVYKPNLENLMKVSKYLLWNLKYFKYGPIFIIVLFLLNFWSSHVASGSIDKQSFADYIGLLIFPVILALIYFRSLSTMKKAILNNKRNFETQNITFSNASYIQEGETFKIESFWNETYQIKETNDWFLIYPKKNSAFPLVKSDLSSDECNNIRALFNSLNIKKSLK